METEDSPSNAGTITHHQHPTIIPNFHSFIHGGEEARTDGDVVGSESFDFGFGQGEAGEEEGDDGLAGGYCLSTCMELKDDRVCQLSGLGKKREDG